MNFLNYTETPQVLQFHGKDAAWLLGSKYDLWCKHVSISHNFGFYFFPQELLMFEIMATKHSIRLIW